MIWRVRGREQFRALASSRRRRRGQLTVSCVRVCESEPPRVAYAIGRHVGNAVVRNRLRRRLRACVHAERERLLPGCAYLIGAGAKAVACSERELRDALRAILAEFSESGV